MCTDLNKFVTVNLPEFLLLVFEPKTVIKIDALEDFQSVTVCYNAKTFYQDYKFGTRPAADPASFDEFVSYCQSKIQCNFTEKRVDYQCGMNVCDLLRMDGWACIYESVGPHFMKFLLFNCLLFVPLHGNAVYYCVHTPPQQFDRYRVVQSFWELARNRWKLFTQKWEINDRPGSGPIRFNIAGLLVNKPIFQTDATTALREILLTVTDSGSATINNTSADGDGKRFDGLKRKLKVMAGRDSAESYKDVYKNAIGNSFPDEIPLGRIKKFANAVVRKIVPRELFGINGNRDQYCKNLCKILNGGKSHIFTVEHIVHRIKVKKVNWLNAAEPNADRRAELMAKFLVWLTNAFVFGRIVHFFWIATTNTPNNGIAYYAKSKWSTACHRKISPLINNCEFFKQLPDEPEDEAVVATTSTLYRNWKVCPRAKSKGVRLIFKLRRKEGVEKQSTDTCLVFLRCLASTYPTEYRSLSKPQFFRGWQSLQESRRQDDSTMSPLYYVRTDFRDAFTSILQDKLQSVVRNRIKEFYDYKSQKLSMHSVDVVKIGGDKTVYCKKRKYFDGLPVPVFPGNSLVFYGQTTTVSMSGMWDMIRKCVQRNVVKMGGRRWLMTRGIVQGDRLSVVLCDLLLADLQATLLKDTVDRGRLYRFVDDYVFVSPDPSAAKQFLIAVCAGFDEYGLQVNRSKTETNLNGTSEGTVKFLGFQLNMNTGEVTKDKSSFQNRRPLHFIDIDLDRGRSGLALYAKMTAPGHHHVPEALVSKVFNSNFTVARNLASIVAQKAFGFVAAVKQYFFHLNPDLLIRTVHAVAQLMYAKIRGLYRHSALTPMQCKWIVYEVYATMFCKYFPNDCHASWAVDQLRGCQITTGRKCNTKDLKAALKRYDYTKMFG